MGFFKKIFKPVSKVLDKIIPNEIKPALPYLAAFAPMFGPTSALMGQGIMQRALISGGLNIGSQLAQEGNEGDINMLSAGLGALSGAMTSPQFGSKIDSLRGLGGASGEAPAGIFNNNKFVDKGLMYLDKGADYMQAPGLTKYGIPASQATGDVMFAQAKRDQDAYDDEMAAESEAEGASNAQRAAAIRQSMESYGFTEEEIEDAIYAAGYKTGGRVGFKNGDYVGSSDNETMEDEYDSYIKEIEIDGDMPMSFSSFKKMLSEDYANGGRVGFNIGGGVSEGKQLLLNKKYVELLKEYSEAGLSDADSRALKEANEFIRDLDFAKGGRVGLRFGGIGAAVENIEDTEMKESAKFAMQDMDVPIMELVQEFEIKFKRKPNSLEELKQYYKDKYKGTGDVSMQEEVKEKVVMEAKDGGLMNLGGKEMDMRGGGFIPIGKKERADDVPARLSKNEFVMTADAVRAAGGGSVNEGAKRMYETMNKLEARA